MMWPMRCTADDAFELLVAQSQGKGANAETLLSRSRRQLHDVDDTNSGVDG
jgi:hypothetical protein